jgi:hypothetical protein
LRDVELARPADHARESGFGELGKNVGMLANGGAPSPSLRVVELAREIIMRSDHKSLPMAKMNRLRMRKH